MAYIPPRQEGCRFSSRPITPQHSVNLPLLNQFFQKEDLADLFANTLLPNPLKVILPKLKVYEANYSHEIAKDKQARFDLQHISNLTKHDREAFSSLAHRMMPTWLQLESGNFDTTFDPYSWKSW